MPVGIPKSGYRHCDKGNKGWFKKGIKTGFVPKTAFKNGERHPNWKGDDASYSAIHHWVANNLKTSNKCEFCRREKDSNYKIQWANKDHEYKRRKEDWVRLCVPCHLAYDKGRKDENEQI